MSSSLVALQLQPEPVGGKGGGQRGLEVQATPLTHPSVPGDSRNNSSFIYKIDQLSNLDSLVKVWLKKASKE